MQFSLVVGTLGRTHELERLLNSLERQTCRDFELIVVDQNADDRLAPILHASEREIKIKHLRCAPGLSRARNVGLAAATGDVLCFPDDDCWYGQDVLAVASELFGKHAEWDGIVGNSVDEAGEATLPWRDREGILSLAMSWRRSISYAIFLRAQVIRTIGGFNETLGVGSGTPWGSGEDNDLVLRALKAGFTILYKPDLCVHHPRLYPNADEAGRKKRYGYALGDGKLLQQHPMPAWWRLLFFLIPAGRMLLAAVRLRANDTRAHWLTLQGRIHGFFSAKNADEVRVSFPMHDSDRSERPISCAAACGVARSPGKR
jgi:glycosyltransferase involved in cell wall biosynthesis